MAAKRNPSLLRRGHLHSRKRIGRIDSTAGGVLGIAIGSEWSADHALSSVSN
jgi:hypothetical protein